MPKRTRTKPAEPDHAARSPIAIKKATPSRSPRAVKRTSPTNRSIMSPASDLVELPDEIASSRPAKPYRPIQAFVEAPETLPNRYGIRVDGDVLTPDVQPGGVLLVDKTMPCRTGDLAVLYLKKDRVMPGAPTAWIVRIVLGPMRGLIFPYEVQEGSNAVPIVMIQNGTSGNEASPIECDRIAALHRALGPIELAALTPTDAAKALTSAAAKLAVDQPVEA